MTRFTFLLAGLLLWLAASQAAPLFAPANYVAVLTTDGVELFDPGLGPRGELFKLAAGDDQPDFLPAPDGNLLVAQGTVLREFDASGTELRKVNFFETITGLELGPGGDIVVATVKGITLWDLEAGQEHKTYGISQGVSPCFMPRGFLGYGDGPTIKVLDLRSGMIVREVNLNGQDILGIARRADGTHAVVAGDELFLLDDNLKEILDHPVNVAGSGNDPAFLPNGDVLLTGASTLTELDGDTLKFVWQVDIPDGDGVSALVVPHVFQVDIDGSLVRADGAVLKVNSAGQVNWTPGSGGAVLRLFDPEAVAALGDDTLVFQGFEAGEGTATLTSVFRPNASEKGEHLVQAMQTLAVPGVAAPGAFGADASGFIGTNGFYFADSFDAQLQAGQGANVLLSTVKTKQLLNP